MNTIDFSLNVNPLGPTKRVLGKIDLEKIVATYPDKTNRIVLESVSKVFAIPANNLAVGTGSTEFFYTMPATIKFKHGLLVAPTFWEYRATLKTHNKKIHSFYALDKNNFEIDIEELRSTIAQISDSSQSIAIYLCQPNNPTSTMMNPNEILRLSEDFSDANFIIDETYLLFRRDYPDISLMQAATERKNMVVVTSLSKFYNVPGLRAGICCSSEEKIKVIKKKQIPYSLNRLAQEIIPIMVEDTDFARVSRESMESEKKRVYQSLANIPHLQVYEPQANFLLVKFKKSDCTAAAMGEYLNDKGMLVRYGREFPGLGDQFIRISIRQREQNEYLLDAIKSYK